MYGKIIGVTKTEKLVVLVGDLSEGVRLCCMERIFKEDIEYKNNFKWADKDLWKFAVRDDETELGFEEWWEDQVNLAEERGLLYPSDDGSFRYLTETLYESLPAESIERIEKVLGKYEEDYVTFGCYLCGSDCINKNTEWELVLEPVVLEKVLSLQ